ncbi:MAG: hypothetical protein AAB927_01370 [Patescibacteria group bacterium]
MRTLKLDVAGSFGHELASRFATFINNGGAVVESQFTAQKDGHPARLQVVFTTSRQVSDFRGFFANILRSVNVDPSVMKLEHA